MGLFISTINEQGSIKSNPNKCWSETLQKVKQYHGMFKYVCDCFVINSQQFKQIFGSLEKAKTWDSKSQGRVDALQIFCGLIIFAKEASFKSKLSFLFSIFDFNQIKSLSFIDVEVIILNVCNSVYKILNKNGKVNETQIADWLGNYFYKRQRIKITRLYKFCLQNQDIQAFFKCINNNIDQTLQFPFSLPNILSETDVMTGNKKRKQPKNKINTGDFCQKNKQQTVSNLQWHKDLINKIVKVQELQYVNGQEAKGLESSYGCKITWVYGINMQGQSKPFITLKKLDNCIAYKASSLAIIHNLQLRNQHIIQGHQQQLCCISYNQKQQILATVQNYKFPNINLWKRQGQGPKIKKNQKFVKYAIIPTNHSKGIHLMEFIARQTLLATVGVREKNTPILIYDFSRFQVTHQIIMQQSISLLFNPLPLLDRTQVNNHIFDTFFVCSESNSIYQICLKNNGIASNYDIKEHSYLQLQKANKILSAVGCFININNPHLRSYKDKSISMAVITGHQSGSVCKMTSYPKFNQQQIISELDGAVQCLQLTSSILAVGAGSYVYVYDLEVLNNKGGLLMTANLKDQQNIDFLSYNIKYFDFAKDYILGVTQAGQFVQIQTKIQLNKKKQQDKSRIQSTDNQRSNCGVQQLKLNLVTTMIKFQGSNIFCILNWKQDSQIILFATKGNKVIGINSLTHQIQDVWQISTVQNIVALDAVTSDQGVCYIICACRSGRLYIRVNWEQSPKYYDCGYQIADAKISKDCSYLLVATRSNYLLFFAQVNKNFTSPRKLLFEHQSPCSINFLDNFKFFLVITSAKNSYIIEIPQLKHKKLNKQTQKISISKVNVKYPYSNGCLGGSMRFSLLSLKQRDIYFFNSHNALQRGNYTVLNTHKCPVSQIAVNQLQSKFYSLGRLDNTLIEWSVFQSKYKTKKSAGYFDRQHQILGIKQSINQFDDLYEFAINRNSSTQPQNQQLKNRNKNQTFFFKGTKLQKLNETIQKHYKPYMQATRRKLKINQINYENDEIQLICQNNQKDQQQNQLQFNKRPPGISLIAEEIYGFQTLHKKSLIYANNGEQIMGYASRFIVRMNIKNKKQIIYQPTNKKISFMTRSELDNEILYCLVQQNPKIYMLYRQPIRTTHHRGIIHLSIYKNYVLSYGIAQNSGFSLNLHNYLTGQLLHVSFTDIKVCQFILVNEKLAVSFNQVRVWECFYPSEFIITASAGCLLPNKKDILLGLYDGRFAILSDRGIFHLHSQIHQKAHDNVIDIIQIKPQKNNQDFQIVSVGRDQKIKIWTSCFEIKIMIPFRHKNNLIFFGQNNKAVLNSETVRVKSMDVFENKILLVMHTGNIIQVQLEAVKKIQNKGNNDETNKVQNQTTLNAQTVSDKSVNFGTMSHQDEDSVMNQHRLNQMTYKWNNLYQIHSVRSKKSFYRRTFFSIHSKHPILASSACDYQLIIRNYETNQILCKLYYQKQRVQCIKFSPKGNLLAVGFNNGNIQFYKVKILKDQTQKIQNVILQSSQIFKQAQNKIFPNKIINLHNMSRNMNMSLSTLNANNSNLQQQQSQKHLFSIINMQYSECSTYFAVSCVIEVQKKSQAFIILYRLSSSLSVNQTSQMKNSRSGTNQSETPCYTQADIIQISSNSQQTLNTNNSKYTKSAYFIEFLSQTGQNKNQSYPQYQNSSQNITKSFMNLNINKKQQLKIRNQKNQVYLIVFQQYLDINKIRINNDNKVKIKTYQIQDKAIYRQDCNINFLKIKFPHFVYARLFNNTDYCFNIQSGLTPSLTKYNSPDDYDNIHSRYQNQHKFQQKQDIQITISQMLTIGENVMYGDSNGKLHIVKLNSLLMNNHANKITEQLTKSKINQTQPSVNALNNRKPTVSGLHKPQRSNMNLSKTYSSHTSFINQIQTSKNYEYLFVSGGVDDAIVKYRLVHQDRNMDLDNVPYPISYKDHHEEYISDDKFYDFLNNIDPIRDEISDVMLDVEQEPLQGKNLKNVESKGTKLQLMRIYGRRAFDKRNNLFEDKQGNIIYYIGPNIIIQNPQHPSKQKHISVDPSPYTKSPQISCITMNEKYLIAATQQENSRIFVWDIYSNTCLSEMKLQNFSIVYHMVQSSTKKVILIYGVNNLLEASMQLINWSERKVIGNVNMMYTGRWKIKDICEISQKQDGLQFVSCGMQHLVFWEYIADTLVYSSFGLNNPQLTNRTFLTVKFADDLIITGCQNGIIYIFKSFELVASQKVHDSAIRTLAIENELIFSGGMDGKVFGTVINVDQIQNYSLRIVQQHKIKIKNPKQKRRSSQLSKSSIRQHKKSILVSQFSSQNQQQKQFILTQEDVQSIVISRNDRNRNKGSQQGLINKIFVGTRSGNIFLLNRQFNNDRSKKNLNLKGNDSNKTISRMNSGLFGSEKFANSNGQIKPIIWAHDNDSIVSVCFDQERSDLFYVLTFSGLLQIWSLKTFKRIYFYKISQQANKVFCFKQFVIICCQKSILSVKVDILSNSIHYIKQMSKQYDGIITQCCLSKSCTINNFEGTTNKDESSQKQSNINSKSSLTESNNKGAYLVIGLKKNQFNQIIINQIQNQIIQKFVVVNLKYQIQFMDFSRNCKYLLFKDSFEELGMVNLQNYKRINTIFVQMGIQWESQGVRISPHGQRIYCSYSRENKITVLRRINDKQIIIGDQMGTLRTFQYPCPEQKIGQLHTQCYATHMNFIKNIQIHPTEPYAITTAVYDRSLILWKLVKN